MKKTMMMVLGMFVSAMVFHTAMADAAWSDQQQCGCNIVLSGDQCDPPCGQAEIGNVDKLQMLQAGQTRPVDNRKRATQQEYEEVTNLVLSSTKLRQEWQAMKNRYIFDPAFANAVEQVIRNPKAIRNFCRIQERFTGNTIDID